MPRWVLVPLLVLLSGCPGAAPGTAAGPIVGQRWRFRSGARGEQTYEVIAVTAREVHYRVRTSYAGEPLGELLDQTFPLRPGPAPLDVGEAGPVLVVGGRAIETWITREGADRITTAVTGRTPVFPGVVRIERGDDVLYELLDVR